MYKQISVRSLRQLNRLALPVSNSSSGCDWELDQIPAMGDSTHMVQNGKGHRLSTAEGQRRVAIQ
jgi:hypothetical protein